MLPSKRESYELIEDCYAVGIDDLNLLEVAIPKLLELGKQEELATLLKVIFSDIRAALDGVEAGVNYLKRHDSDELENDVNIKILVTRSPVNTPDKAAVFNGELGTGT